MMKKIEATQKKFVYMRYVAVFFGPFAIVVFLAFLAVSSKEILFALIALGVAPFVLYYFWKSTFRVWFSEKGIHSRALFLKQKILPWEQCKSIIIVFLSAGMYSYYTICFSDNIRKCESFQLGILRTPLPSNQIVHVAYSELIWDEVIKYAPKKLYKEAYAQSAKLIWEGELG
jgi:hypothetical protein